MTYTVSMRVDGRVNVEVEAASANEAFDKADEAFMNADLTQMEIVESYPICAEDEDGNLNMDASLP
jgi:SHS2 domain-containing protein